MSRNVDFINEKLSFYLKDKEHEWHHDLIEFIIKSDSIDAKYNLWNLLMEYGTRKLCIQNLTERLCNFYAGDKDITAYVDQAVYYNPKLGYVGIEAKSRRDMKDDCSLSIDIRCSEENADQVINRIKEVLTMILIETQTIKR